MVKVPTTIFLEKSTKNYKYLLECYYLYCDIGYKLVLYEASVLDRSCSSPKEMKQ